MPFLSRVSILLSIACLFASAGPVTVSCGGATPVYTNNGYSGSCLGFTTAYNPTGDIPASSDATQSFSITHDLGSGFYSLSESVSTNVFAGTFDPLRPPTGNSTALATIDYQQVFNAGGGSIRPGFLEIQNSGETLADYYGNQTLTIGFPNGSLVGVPAGYQTQSSCVRNVGCGFSDRYYHEIIPFPLPVTLGTNLTLVAESTTLDHADLIDGLGGSSASASFVFRFTEIDGSAVTLIPIAAPEPASLGLTALALGGAFIARRVSTLKARQ